MTAPLKGPKKVSPKFWTMKTGQVILITEMEDSHLENTIAMIERKIEKDLKSAVPFEDWEDGDPKPRHLEYFKAKLGMLVNERDRRIGEHKWTLRIDEKIRIEFEGPAIGSRVI